MSKPPPKRRVDVYGSEYFLDRKSESWTYYKNLPPTRRSVVKNMRAAAMLDRIAELEAELEAERENKP